MKRRHIRMANRQPLAQALHEGIKIHAAVERAQGGGANMRTLTALADRMALRAHSFRRSAAALLQRSGVADFGQAGRRCEEQKDDCEPHDDFPIPRQRPANSIEKDQISMADGCRQATLDRAARMVPTRADQRASKPAASSRVCMRLRA